MALMRGERHLENAVLARQRYRLAEVRPNGRIEFGAGVLRMGEGPVPAAASTKATAMPPMTSTRQDRSMSILPGGNRRLKIE